MTVLAQSASTSGSSRKIAWPPGTTALLWAIIAFGAVLRLARWIHWRSLWLDEIYLANSLLSRSLHDLLFRPLEDWQAAPPGFLVLVHLTTRVFGGGERSLRLLSLLFGLASLPLMLAVARRLLQPGSAVAAVAMFTFLGPLIYYSNELKPYSCDVAVSLAITLAVLRWMENRTFRRAAAAALVGAAGIFLSYPSIFVLAGAGAIVLWPMRRTGNDARRRQGLWVCSIWATVFAAEYLIFVRQFAGGEAHPHLVQYWAARDAFMPHSPVAAFTWTFSCLSSIARDPGGMWLDYPDAAVLGLIVGLIVALRRRDHLLILLAPLPLVLLASAMKQYPFGDRLALFFVPQYLLLIAVAFESLWTTLAGKTAALAMAAMILLPSARRANGYLFSPPGREESLPAYRWVASRWYAGDQLYLTHFGEESFRLYRSQSDWPADLDRPGALHIQPQILGPRDILEDVKPFAGKKRVWVILIHAEGGEFDVHQFTVAAFDDVGVPIVQHSEPGAMIYLYDCSAPSRTPGSG
ncbi:MAG: glycosyltransferase family 39 protein [Tepidisphaeraceae bacterium]